MKNVFLLPTQNKSNIVLLKENNKLYYHPMILSINPNIIPQYVYITTEEKFNENEYLTDGIEVIQATPKLVEAQGLVDRREWKKIIITNDPELIENGVQKINQNFLNWLSENQSCESVGIEQNWEGNGVMFGFKMGGVSPDGDIKYKIITPKEPKITLELTQQEARGLLNCLMRTSANGKDLDVGEIVEEKLWEFLKPLESK